MWRWGSEVTGAWPGSEDGGHLMALLLMLLVGGAARQLVEASLPGPPQVLHQQGGTSEYGHTAQHRDQDRRQGWGGATRPFDPEAEGGQLVAQLVGHVDLVRPRVAGCHPAQQEGAVGGAQPRPLRLFPPYLPQVGSRGGPAHRPDQNCHILALLHLPGWQHLYHCLPGRS